MRHLRSSRSAFSSGRVRWTYHVTMRLQQRAVTAEMVRGAIETLEIIEMNTSICRVFS
jgi:hypothetical protein